MFPTSITWDNQSYWRLVCEGAQLYYSRAPLDHSPPLEGMLDTPQVADYGLSMGENGPQVLLITRDQTLVYGWYDHPNWRLQPLSRAESPMRVDTPLIWAGAETHLFYRVTGGNEDMLVHYGWSGQWQGHTVDHGATILPLQVMADANQMITIFYQKQEGNRWAIWNARWEDGNWVTQQATAAMPNAYTDWSAVLIPSPKAIWRQGTRILLDGQAVCEEGEQPWLLRHGDGWLAGWMQNGSAMEIYSSDGRQWSSPMAVPGTEWYGLAIPVGMGLVENGWQGSSVRCAPYPRPDRIPAFWRPPEQAVMPVTPPAPVASAVQDTASGAAAWQGMEARRVDDRQYASPAPMSAGAVPIAATANTPRGDDGRVERLQSGIVVLQNAFAHMEGRLAGLERSQVTVMNDQLKMSGVLDMVEQKVREMELRPSILPQPKPVMEEIDRDGLRWSALEVRLDRLEGMLSGWLERLAPVAAEYEHWAEMQDVVMELPTADEAEIEKIEDIEDIAEENEEQPAQEASED